MSFLYDDDDLPETPEEQAFEDKLKLAAYAFLFAVLGLIAAFNHFFPGKPAEKAPCVQPPQFHNDTQPVAFNCEPPATGSSP